MHLQYYEDWTFDNLVFEFLCHRLQCKAPLSLRRTLHRSEQSQAFDF